MSFFLLMLNGVVLGFVNMLIIVFFPMQTLSISLSDKSEVHDVKNKNHNVFHQRKGLLAPRLDFLHCMINTIISLQ